MIEEIQFDSSDPSTRVPLDTLIELTQIPGTDIRTVIDVRAQRLFGGLSLLDRWCAVLTEALLQRSETMGHIALGEAMNILEFGPGTGGSTLALAALCEKTGGSLEVVENDPEFAEALVANSILPAGQVHLTDDGVDYLRGKEHRGDYDLIAACMLGPDETGELSLGLLTASQNALAPGGQLFVCSDATTMKIMQQACKQTEVNHRYIKGTPFRPGKAVLLDVLITFT